MIKRRYYHTDIKIAAALGILSQELLALIPKSSRQRFKSTDYSNYFGVQEARYLKQNMDFLKEILKYKEIIKKLKAVIHIKNTIFTTAMLFRNMTLHQTMKKIIRTISYVKKTLPLDKILKYFNLTKGKYRYWKNIIHRCKDSVIKRCFKRHPGQLTKKEVSIIKKYASDEKYSHWPIYSLAWHAVREGVLFVKPDTWYKYLKLLGIKRQKPKHRRKKLKTGIRASLPNQIWHADVTLFKTLDNTLVYIYLIMDNFSRYILNWKASLNLSGKIRKESIQEAYEKHILKNHEISKIDLIVDGGSENNCESVENFLAQPEIPIKKIIALKDIDFSNSLIESVNKTIKYRYLFRKSIQNLNELQKYLDDYIPEYNERIYHSSLNGLTPHETYNGFSFDKDKLKQSFEIAGKERILFNQENLCVNHD